MVVVGVCRTIRGRILNFEVSLRGCKLQKARYSVYALREPRDVPQPRHCYRTQPRSSNACNLPKAEMMRESESGNSAERGPKVGCWRGAVRSEGGVKGGGQLFGDDGKDEWWAGRRV